MPQRTASPVPRASGWIAAIASSGSSARTSSASGGVTTTSREAPASRAASSTQPRIGRPQVACRTFGSADRMRVPFPPAITMQARRPRTAVHVTAAPRGILDSRVSGARRQPKEQPSCPFRPRSTRSPSSATASSDTASRRCTPWPARTSVLIGRSDESLARAIENIRASLADFTRHGLVTRRRGRRRRWAGSATSTDLAGRGRRAAGDRGGHARHAAEGGAVRASSTASARRRRCWRRRAARRPARCTSRVAHRERVIATHFWYPPQLIPLVEVCGSRRRRPTCWRGRATPCARAARSRP